MDTKKEKGNRRTEIASKIANNPSSFLRDNIPNKKIRYEELVSGFSEALNETPENDLESVLNSWIEKFVTFLKVDRCVVTEYMPDLKTMHVLLNYALPEVYTIPVVYEYQPVDGVIGELKKGIIIKAEKIPDDLPQIFRGGLIEKDNTKSIVIIPLIISDEVIGSLTFACYKKERKWSLVFLRRIKLIGEIIANAIQRIRSYKSLLEITEHGKQLEETYSSVIKNVNLGFMIIRLTDHAVIDVNDEYCRMSGYTREELIDKKTWEIDASMDPEKVEKEKRIALKEGAIRIISSHKRKDGSLFDVEVSSSLFGRKDYVYSFIRDITALNNARRELEERLKFEELVSQFSNTLVNCKSDGINDALNLLIIKLVEFFKVDRGVIGEFERDQNTVKIIVSYTSDEFNLMPLEERYSVSDTIFQEYDRGIIINAKRISESLPEEILCWTQNEKIKSFVNIPLMSENRAIGNITLASHSKECDWPDDLVKRIKLIGEIIANAILRMHSQKKLIKEVEHREQLEETYSSVIKNANLGFMILNLSEHKIIDVNDEYCRMSGYTREELLEKKIWEIDSSMDKDKVISQGEMTTEEGAIHFKASHKRKNGSLFDVEISSNFFSKNSNIVYSFIRDITEINRTHKELEERLEFEELLSDFSATLVNPDESNQGLYKWLKKFVEFLDVDRGVVIEYLDDKETVEVLMQYSVPDIDILPLKKRYITPQGEIEEFQTGLFVRAEKVPDDLPPMLRGGLIEKENTRSVVIVPLSFSGKIIGSLTFASYRNEHRWSDEVIKRIRLIGEIIANAILRKRTRDALHKEMERSRLLEEKYSSILKHANVGFFISSFSDLSILDVNDEYCRMTGYNRNEILTKKIWELDSSGDPEKVKLDRDAMMHQKGLIHFETSHICKDGNKIDVTVSANYFESDGVICCFVNDVTELKKAQSELEERLKFEELISEFSAELINVSPENIFNELDKWLKKLVELLNVDRGIINEHLYDQNMIHLLINYSTLGIDIPLTYFHKTPSNINEIFKKRLSVKAEKIPDDLPQGMRGGIVEKENVRSIVIVPIIGGNEIIGNLTLMNYRNERRWPDDLVSQLKLIGEIIGNALLRKRSHETLIKEMEQRERVEERYSSIVKNANVGFWISDVEQNILDVNDEYCRMSGYSREEILTMKVPEIDISFDTDPEKILKELVTTGSVHHEVKHRKKDGSIIDISVSSTLNKKEEILYSFMKDITDEKRAKIERDERLAFEKLVSEFSASLMNIKLEDINVELKTWLEKFVDFLDIGRGVINEYDYDNNTMIALVNVTASDSVSETSPHDTVLKTTDTVMNEFKKGAMIRAEKIPEDLPEPFRGWIIEKHNTKSLVVVPLVSESQIIGNLTLASYIKERKWTDDIFNRIKLIGEIIASAILRLRTHEALTKAQNELRERLEFEEVISGFSNALIYIKPEDIKNELVVWLKKIVELLKVDSGLIIEYQTDQQNVHTFVQYTISGLDIPIEQNHITPAGIIEELRKGEIIQAEKIPDDLPLVYRDGLFEKYNTKSVIIVPLLTGDRVFGNITFASYQEERRWSDGIIKRIKLIGEITGNAILRIRAYEALNQAQADLRERLEFEEVISEFSTALINIKPEYILSELEKWFDKFIVLLDADRCAVNEYSDDQQIIKNLIQHSVPEVDVILPAVRKTPEGEIDVLKKGIIKIEKIPEELPEMFHDNFIERSKVKALIIIPLLTGNRIFGNLAIANHIKERKWSDELIRRIKLIGEIVGNAILRMRSHEALIREMERRHFLEERYSSIIKTANVGFMISDLNANILEVNDAYCEMSGYSRDELLTMKINQLDISSNPDKIERDKDTILRTGAFNHETGHIRKDGKIINVLVSANLLPNEGIICGFIKDVTELKIAREDLEERLEFEKLTSEFSAVLINLNLGTIEKDLNPWIEKFVIFLEVERGIVNEYDYEKRSFNIMSTYTAPLVDAPPLDKSYESPPSVMDTLAKGDIIKADRIPDDLPPMFHDSIIMKHKTKSILIVPLSAENKIIGDLTFITYSKEHKWSDEFVRRIKLIGEMIANAISRKRSSDALITEMQNRQKLEEKYTSIIKTANVGFWISDTDQNILAVNDEYCRMSGYSRDELLTMKVADIDSSKDYEQIEKDGAASISRGASHRERKHIRKDGSVFDVEISANYLSSEGLFFCFTRDITELNLAKKELVERLTFEELVSEFSAALINVKITDMKPELDNWLRRFSELLNVDRWTTGQYEENYGIYRFICSYINPHLDPKPPERPMVMINDRKYGLDKYLMKGEILKLDSINDKFPEDLSLWQQLVRGDGTKSILMLPLMVGETLLGRMVIATIVHEKKWTDEIIRRLKLVAEIFANSLMREKKDSELENYRKHLEEMVKERTARLEKTQKELLISEKMATLGRLTATVSHELRNPLGTIRTSVFAIGKRLKGEDEKITVALDRAERNIRRCDLIIDELLNYSRVKELVLEPTSLDDWIKDVLYETKPPKGISLKTEFNAGELISLDRERFRQTVVNILTNAYQAIEEKHTDEPGCVTVSTMKEDNVILLEISDNGIGFDMAIKSKLFEPLFSTKAFGVGLGLSITRQIIEQHGFKMDMRSEPGKGASVTITIPVIDRE